MRHIFLLAIFCPFLSMCQPISLKGKIINEQHQPVSGATVTVKRVTAGPARINSTFTNNAGEFSITQLGLGDTIVVTAIGYEPQTQYYDYTLTKESFITVILRQRVAIMEEVVVNTGYQSLPKERATGSFTFLKNDLLNQQVSTGILERLPSIANALSMVPPTAGPPDMTIRGFSTISGPRVPLIVLDNFPFDGNISDINPNDIQSITLLKDAAAASIWGAKAGNGVIVITTKKASFNQKLRIDVNANVSLAEKPNLFTLQQIGTSDFIDVERFLFDQQYRFADTASNDHIPFSPVYEILFSQRNGQLSESEAQKKIDVLRNYDVRNDYAAYMYRQPVSRQYALNLHGGSPLFAWLASAGFDNNVNELSGKYDRLTLRFQNNIRAINKIELLTDVYFTNSSTTAGKSGYASINSVTGGLPPYTRLADANGVAQPVYSEKRKLFVDTAGGGRLLDWNFYPLTDDQYRHITQASQYFSATAGLVYHPLRFISFNVKYRFEQQQSNGRSLYDVESYYVRNLVNTFSQINSLTGDVSYAVPPGQVLDLANSRLTEHDLRSHLNLDGQWNKHHLSALAGMEISQAKAESNNYRTYGYDDNTLTFSNIDFANTYFQFHNGYTAFIPNPADFSSTLHRFVSLFANTAYTYNEKYIVSVSARRDASNLFGVNTNNKWAPLWSAGLSWLASSERFYNVKLFPYLKLRITYGYRGNVDPSMAGVTTINYTSNSQYTLTPRATVRNFYNPDLRWEKVGMMNAAVDFATHGNRITGSLEYFRKKSTDLYGPVPIDVTAGLSVAQVTKNVAVLKGNGLDLELNSLNTKGKCQWSSNLNFNYYSDKVSRFYNVKLTGSSFVGGGSKALQGYPLFTLFAYKWAGLDPATGDPLGEIDGHTSSDYQSLTGPATEVSDLVYVGKSLPPVYGSLANTLTWHNFSLTVRLSYKFGYYFFRESINYSALFSRGLGHSDFADRWQSPGDEQITSVPSMIFPASAARDAFYNHSQVLVSKGDHIRLQYINFSWNPDVRKTTPFHSLSVYIVMNNLGIIWRENKFNIDPDYGNEILPPKSVSAGVRFSL